MVSLIPPSRPVRKKSSVRAMLSTGLVLAFVGASYVGVNALLNRSYNTANTPSPQATTTPVAIHTPDVYDPSGQTPVYVPTIEIPEFTPVPIQGMDDISIQPTQSKPDAPQMGHLYMTSKSLDEYFSDLDNLSPADQEAIASSMDFGGYDLTLLGRYVPIDSILRYASLYYGTDFKWHLQIMFAESTLNPMAVGPTNDKGLGQIIQETETQFRNKYQDSSWPYRYPGVQLNDNIFDIQTNIILSSINYRFCAEMDMADLDALYSFYTNGWVGVSQGADGKYYITDMGQSDAARAHRFDALAMRLVEFSWLSMDRRDLINLIPNEYVKSLAVLNTPDFDGEQAYIGVLYLLQNARGNPYFNDAMLQTEEKRILGWLKDLYGLDSQVLTDLVWSAPTELPTPFTEPTATMLYPTSSYTNTPLWHPSPTGTPVPSDTPVPTDTPVPPTHTPIPTNTPVPPTHTPIPTNTPVPPTYTPIPTNTPVPPTYTPIPTDTPVPPTYTPIPTDTPVPPTDTPVPTDVPPTDTPADTPSS